MTPDILHRATACSLERAERFAVGLTQIFGVYGISTPLRQAHFLAQVGHESGSFRWTSEIWGPTAQQKRYERDFTKPWTKTDPRNSLAFQLGNSEPGDGSRFRGHGLIQVTGRANHRAFYQRIHKLLFNEQSCMYVPDFEQEPELLATDSWAVYSAGDYWNSRSLNTWADKDDVETVTRKINGGLNGFDDRKKRLALAKRVLLS